MVRSEEPGKIYTATYSNVPVYELNVNGEHVMRKRENDWVNATHILKVAAFDKPARTRILEREIQKGTHKKVQGGYGKFQGTWVPLGDGRQIAEQHGVLHLLRPLFDFVPGDKSPPPAPKHTTAASSRPKVVKQPLPKRVPKPVAVPSRQPSEIEEDFENSSVQILDELSPTSTIASGDEDEFFEASQLSTASRKRKRTEDQHGSELIDQQHMTYADALLDYFVASTTLRNQICNPPAPPENFQVDRPIDDHGHTALHWAAAMADMEVVKFLLGAGASIGPHSVSGETPLMRAVLFTNNFEKRTMAKLIKDLRATIPATDNFGSTVFHHIAATTSTKTARIRLRAAKYYIESICNKMSEDGTSDDVSRILDMQDDNGDTALIIAARNGASRCVSRLLSYSASPSIGNNAGETADYFILQMKKSMQDSAFLGSSSPFQTFDRSSKHQISSFNSQMLQANPHHSETAIAVSQKLAPLIMQQTEKLASAYDGELIARERDQHDADQLLEKNKGELGTTRQEVAELSAYLDDDPSLSEAENQEVKRLEHQLASLIEFSQTIHLRNTVENEERNRPMWNGPSDDPTNKLVVAARLHEEQARRLTLVKEIVVKASAAGAGERHRDYKRLIKSCVEIDEDDIENSLSDLVAFLEADKESANMEVDQEPVGGLGF